METRTYTEKSNARRAARVAGVDPKLVVETEDGFTFPAPSIEDDNMAAEEPTPLKTAISTAIERGISPKQFVAIAEKVANDLDGIPPFLQRAPLTEDEKATLAAKSKQYNSPDRTIEMPKRPIAATSNAKKPKGAKGGDKTALLLSMLKGKGSTVEQLTKALDWLPHTLRARISRLPKEDKKIKIERTRVDGVTTYRVAS